MNLSFVYLVVGTEEYRKEEFISKLEKKIITNESSSLDVVHFDGETISADTVIAEANQYPFLCDKRFILVRHAEKMLDEKVILEYVKDPSDTTILVFIATKMDKRTSAYKIFKKYVNIKEFQSLDSKDEKYWIQEYVRSNGKVINLSATKLICEESENNLNMIKQELDKLILYIGDRAEITEDDVSELIIKSRVEDSFDLTNAIRDHDSSKTLVLFNKLLEQGHSLPAILGLIRWYLRRLWSVKQMEGKSSVGKMAGALRMSPYQLKMIIEQSRGVSIDYIKFLTQNLMDTEIKIRTYDYRYQNILMELACIRLSGQKG